MEKRYTLGEVIDKMKFNQVAILVKGGGEKPYSQTGTAIYFDKKDDGRLKFLNGEEDVCILRAPEIADDVVEEWIIVDR